MRPTLHYMLKGQRVSYPLEQDEVSIGRSRDNDLVIPEPSISRHHAKVYREDGTWKVTDLGSQNGTRLNGAPADKTALKHSDKIYLDRFVLTFEDAAQAEALPAGPVASAPDPTSTIYRPAVDFSTLAESQVLEDPTARLPEGERLRKLLKLLTAASETLLSSPSLENKLRLVLGLVFQHLSVQRAGILLWDEDANDFVTKYREDRGAPAEASEHDLGFSRTIADRVYKDKVAVIISDAQSDERFADGASVFALGIRSAMAAPLWTGDNVEGILYVDTPGQVHKFTNFDLDLLSALGNHVGVAIQQARLQESMLEQKMVRRRLERYHSPAVVDRIATMSDAADSALQADEHEVTVLFADVVDFTRRCEGMQPHQVAEMLNRYFSQMAEMIFLQQGTLDKFIGDCVMAVFGAPLRSDEHAVQAVETALSMREALAKLNATVSLSDQLQFRVGMHSGTVVAGDIGSVRRSDYTVLGSTVNIAARLESGVAQPGQIVVSESTLAGTGERFVSEPIGEHTLKGVRDPIQCFAVLDRRRS